MLELLTSICGSSTSTLLGSCCRFLLGSGRGVEKRDLHARGDFEVLLRLIRRVARCVDIGEIESYGCAAPNGVEERGGEDLDCVDD